MTGRVVLADPFRPEGLDPRLSWFCEPTDWRIDREHRSLVVAPDAGTDFWQGTHYGFRVDTGHFLHLAVAEDVEITAQVAAAPVHRYDQAGLMVRVSPTCWLKTSVEHEPDAPDRLGAVVTNGGWSDWSTQDVPDGLTDVWFRIRREGADYVVSTSDDGDRWTQIRLAHLLDDRPGGPVDVGVYAASPTAAGFRAEVRSFEIRSFESRS